MFIVGTDGYRLSEGITKINNEKELNKEIIIPLSTAQEINKILQNIDGDVEIYISENQILFIFEDIKLISRLIVGNYPDYKQIIPKNPTTKAIILKQDFISSLKISNIFSDKFNQIDLAKNKKALIYT